MKHADLILVGAGLGNTLLAYRLLQKKPGVKIIIIEEASRPRADRTWSFHESDVAPEVWRWLQPLAAQTWAGYDVHFPKFSRALEGAAYASLRGDSLLRRAGLESHVRWNTRAIETGPDFVTLESGEILRATAVVDGRGQGPRQAGREGYQKFYGLQLKLKAPHGLNRPVVMDATVAQTDGYRFFYLLPWSATQLLVEDTYYADEPYLDREALRRGVEAYVKGRGWEIEVVEGEEASALPIPLHGEKAAPPPFTIGVKAQLFQPVTGYSVPYAAEVAERWDPLAPDAGAALRKLQRALTKRNRFYYLLNRMLFLAAAPAERRQIFEKFYRHPEALIQRFYAGQSSLLDCALTLSGRPPVPVAPALKAMWKKEAVA